MTVQDKVWLKLMEWGHALGCHQMESRSFSFHGYQFPLCARCTGVFIGELAAIVLIIAGVRLQLIAIAAGIGIMGLDWLIQYLEIRMSNNIRRLITGTLCGTGVTYIYFYVFRFIWKCFTGNG